MATHEGLVLLAAIADGSPESDVVLIDALGPPGGGDVAVVLDELAGEGLIERVGVPGGDGVRVTAEGLLVLNPQNSR